MLAQLGTHSAVIRTTIPLVSCLDSLGSTMSCLSIEVLILLYLCIGDEGERLERELAQRVVVEHRRRVAMGHRRIPGSSQSLSCYRLLGGFILNVY